MLSCQETDSSLCQRVDNRGNRNNLLRIRFSRWPAHSAANVVPVEVEGVSCDALVDTGSMVTTIAESFWMTKLASVPLRPLQDLIWAEGANGLEVKYLGYVEVSLRMQHGVAGPEQMHRAPVLVVVNMQYNAKVPLIVGTNIIRCCYKWGVDHSGPKFWMNTQVQPAWRMAFDSFRASTASPKFKVQLVTRSQAQLAPGEAALLEGQTAVKWRHSLTSKLRSPLLVEPLLVEEPVKVFIEVKNGGQETIILSNGKTLCFLGQITPLEPAEEVIGPGTEVQPDFDLGDIMDDEGRSGRAKVLLQEWEDTFARRGPEIGCTKNKQHYIPQTDETPFRSRTTTVPPAMFDATPEGDVRMWGYQTFKQPLFIPSGACEIERQISKVLH